MWRGERDDELDEGFTLVELIVASLLTVLVLTLAGTLVVSGMNAQAQVQSVTAASDSSQSLSNAVESYTRDASYVRVTQPSGDSMVVLRVPADIAVTSYHCVAFYWSSARAEVRMKQATGPISAPSASVLTTWSLIATDVARDGSETVFTGDGATNSAYLQLAAELGENAEVPVFNRTYARNFDSMVVSPCF
jgi:type II secretory pathway pseudopilin PulG